MDENRVKNKSTPLERRVHEATEHWTSCCGALWRQLQDMSSQGSISKTLQKHLSNTNVFRFLFLCRHPLGTHVPGTTTLIPLPGTEQSMPTPRAKKGALREMSRHPNRAPTRRPAQAQTQATNGHAGFESGVAEKERCEE